MPEHYDEIIQELLRAGPPLLPERGPGMRADERSGLRRWLDRVASKPLDPLGLLRRGDVLPGAQQALAAKDVAELKQLRTGTPFETDPLQAAKTQAYYGARVGENVWSPIMDAHFVRGIGLPDVRPARGGDLRGSIGEREAGRVADWYARKVAQPVGMHGVGAQALQWNVLGPQTKVESPLGAGLMEIMADLAARKAQTTGQTPREALDAFIRGEQDLFVPREGM